MDTSLQLELKNIYQELDAEVAGHKTVCRACGTCCNFEKFDHILFASRLEVNYIINNLNKPLPALDDGFCPFQAGAECGIRDLRTLGCRVFYCNEQYNRNASPDIYNKYYRKIKGLALKHNRDWKYKPLIGHLRDVAALDTN